MFARVEGQGRHAGAPESSQHVRDFMRRGSLTADPPTGAARGLCKPDPSLEIAGRAGAMWSVISAVGEDQRRQGKASSAIGRETRGFPGAT